MDAKELSKILFHLGEEVEANYQPVSPSVVQSSNFAFVNADEMSRAIEDESNKNLYTRGCNPTVDLLRRKMAALEGAEDAWVFASGSAAMSAAMLSQMSAGREVICVSKPYSWTYKLLTGFCARFGVKAIFVDGRDAANIENAITEKTCLIVLESPNSLTLELQDLAAIAKMAKARSIPTICDNSYCSPLSQRPLALGIDMVVHSASKYLNGHSDVVAGVLCGSSALIKDVFKMEYMALGAAISPHDAWLIIRGLRTLELRIDRSSSSALYIANALDHQGIKAVHYPFIERHPQYELAVKQMSRAMGMFTLEFNCERTSQINAFCDELEYFRTAVSWGGYESLVLPTSILSDSSNVPLNLVRVYIGLEDKDLLLEDLQNALKIFD